MKPFLSYIGSKQKFMKKIELFFPETINNYYEPFVGGGSVFFYLNQTRHINKNFINDLDLDVINVYKVIKSNSKKLISYLEKLNTIHTKKDFENLVKVFNENKSDKVLLAAIYIYLNKRSFNGNLKYGKDNIAKPYYSKQAKNINIYNNDNIEDISKLLNNTLIKKKDYIQFLKEYDIKKGDFVFFDPPYLVNGIQQYYKETFDFDNFKNLKHVCDKLDKKGINFMITLNKHPKLKELFKEYNIKIFKKKYSGMSNGKFDEYEMIITNY